MNPLMQIMPIISGSLNAVPKVGSEDHGELLQDGLLMAAKMLNAAQQKGKDPDPGSIAYYVLQSLKSGRRSGYAGKCDALSAACCLQNDVVVQSLDQEIGSEYDEDSRPLTLHDVLADGHEDPTQEAARRLDWEMLELSESDRALLAATSAGIPGKTIAQECCVSPAAITLRRRAIGRNIKNAWQIDSVSEIYQEPQWHHDLRVARG